MKKLRSLIGSKAFYRTVLAIAVPVMIQNGITQFVSLLDNLMVGQLGTEQMSGVAIGNQLIFIYNLCIFGGLAGAGIFGAQFSGKRDVDGVRNVFRFKLLICAAVFAVGLTVLGLFHEQLIGLFLHDGSAEGDLALTLEYGARYLRIMLIGFLPHALSQAYASTLRESGETVKPMIASIAAVFTNLVFNYILIFGKFGFPALGASGAAIATVISRFVEFALIVYWAHAHPERTPYFMDVYQSFRIPKELSVQIIHKGLPLLFNEALWSMGISMLNQCYSVRGLSAIAATNIASTVSMLFNTIFMALGSSIGILVGNQLGAGKLEEAVDTNNKMTAFSVASCLVLGVLLFAVSGIIPNMYNTSEEVRGYATSFLRTIAVCMPLHAFSHACYFTLRTGGLTRITMLFDSGYVWLICFPTAFILSRFTDVPVTLLYFICNAVEIIKCFVGYFFVRSKKWVNTIVPS